MRVILASGSPRRKELLSQMGIEYEVIVSDVDESTDVTEPAKLVEDLSRKKAMAVFEILKNNNKIGADGVVVIGADTVVAMDGEILGKPCNEVEAKDMLCKLSGRDHEVFTGVTLNVRDKEGGEFVKIFYDKTTVSFGEMTEAEIDEYISSGEPMDKAGAYGIQGIAAKYINGINGDYNTVVGLPVRKLYQEIKDIL